MSQAELARVRDWARQRIGEGSEPPWSSFLLKRLCETIDALLAGMAASPAEASPPPAAPTPRLVVCNAPRDGDRGRRGPLRARASARATDSLLPGEKAKPPVTEPVS